MGKINWGRVFLCGMLTAIVWYLLSSLLLAFLGKESVAVLFAASPPTYPENMRGFYAFRWTTTLATGIWAMWLYAAIRPRYGPGPKTAAVAGFAWWAIRVLSDFFWGALGLIPLGVLLVPLAAFLLAHIAAVVLGAWPYEE